MTASRTTKVLSLVTALSLVLPGCATSSKDVATTYVSPMQFQSYDCNQLAAESSRIQTRVSQLAGRLDEAAANDKAITGVALILFWPAAFALGGQKGNEAEYARLKGEHDAILQQATIKKCSVNPPPAVPAPAMPAETTPKV